LGDAPVTAIFTPELELVKAKVGVDAAKIIPADPHIIIDNIDTKKILLKNFAGKRLVREKITKVFFVVIM